MEQASASRLTARARRPADNRTSLPTAGAAIVAVIASAAVLIPPRNAINRPQGFTTPITAPMTMPYPCPSPSRVMPQILLVQPAQDPDRAAALAAQLSTPGGWNVSSATPSALDNLEADALRAFDLVAVELSIATDQGGEQLKELAAIRGQGPVLVTARPDADADALASALACGAAGLAVCDGNSRKVLECAARMLGDVDQDGARRRLLASMTESRCVFEIGTDPDLLPALVTRLQNSVAMFCVCDPTERARIGVAVEEALSNALYHGNLELDSKLRENGVEEYYALAAERRGLAPYRNRTVHVTEMLTLDEVRITIRDQGPGFDTSKLTATADEPDDDAEFVIPSGRGFMLMQAFMDEVSYNDAGNEVTLVKRRNTSANLVFSAA